MTDWGVPDWRDFTVYYRLFAKLAGKGLQWQLLRRNPAYRDEWLQYRQEGQRRAFAPDSLEKYGLELLTDPSDPKAPEFRDTELVLPALEISDGRVPQEIMDFVQQASAGRYYLAKLDPSESWGVNSQRVQKQFEAWVSELEGKMRHSRMHAYTLVERLRLIDAGNEDATYDEIADFLQAHGASRNLSVEAVERRYRRAIRMAERVTGVPWPKRTRKRRS